MPLWSAHHRLDSFPRPRSKYARDSVQAGAFQSGMCHCRYPTELTNRKNSWGTVQKTELRYRSSPIFSRIYLWWYFKCSMYVAKSAKLVRTCDIICAWLKVCKILLPRCVLFRHSTFNHWTRNEMKWHTFVFLTKIGLVSRANKVTAVDNPFTFKISSESCRTVTLRRYLTHWIRCTNKSAKLCSILGRNLLHDKTLTRTSR